MSLMPVMYCTRIAYRIAQIVKAIVEIRWELSDVGHGWNRCQGCEVQRDNIAAFISIPFKENQKRVVRDASFLCALDKSDCPSNMVKASSVAITASLDQRVGALS